MNSIKKFSKSFFKYYRVLLLKCWDIQKYVQASSVKKKEEGTSLQIC